MKRQAEAKKPGAAQQSVPGEWMYVAPDGVNVRRIAAALPKELNVELWEEAGVLEIALGEKQSMDIEQGRIHPKDAVTRSFVEAHNCAEVFLVTFAPENYEQTKEIMRSIISECGGVFCGDTEDFSPMLEA